METDAPPKPRRDALWAAGVLAALGVLWLILRLYWQGALILGAAAALWAFGRRMRSTPEKSAPPSSPPAGADRASQGGARSATPAASGKGKGKKRRR